MNEIEIVPNQDTTAIIEFEPDARALHFCVGDKEVLRFEGSGDIYVRGTLTTNDMAVVKAAYDFFVVTRQLMGCERECDSINK